MATECEPASVSWVREALANDAPEIGHVFAKELLQEYDKLRAAQIVATTKRARTLSCWIAGLFSDDERNRKRIAELRQLANLQRRELDRVYAAIDKVVAVAKGAATENLPLARSLNDLWRVRKGL